MMSDDVLTLADRLWRGEASIAEHHPLRHLGGLAEVGDGVAFVPSFGNVCGFATADGLVLVDTGSSLTAAAVHDELRRWSRDRLNTVIYSHGHIDHVCGLPAWEPEGAAAGWPAPVVIAHEALPHRFDRYIAMAGYNEVINRRQFGVAGLRWPVEYRYPDRTYRDALRLGVGGRTFLLRHEKGETDDHTVTWVPGQRVLCCGDLFIWASPNAGNPQKVQRYPREWAMALRRMVALEPEYLLPGHGLPVIGAQRVRQALTDTADLLDSLVDQTLAVMNSGGRLDDALHAVAPPAALMDRPYLQPVYDEPEFIVRTVWRQYGGWWDGNPANLKPAPERALAAELACLAGGARALANRARELLADAGERDRGEDPGGTEGAPREDRAAGLPAGRGGGAPAGRPGETALRLACHLAELAWLADPGDPAIARVRHDVFAARADAATSTMATGIFRWAAQESLSRQALPGLGQRREIAQPVDHRIGAGAVERGNLRVRRAHAPILFPADAVHAVRARRTRRARRRGAERQGGRAGRGPAWETGGTIGSARRGRTRWPVRTARRSYAARPRPTAGSPGGTRTRSWRRSSGPGRAWHGRSTSSPTGSARRAMPGGWASAWPASCASRRCGWPPPSSSWSPASRCTGRRAAGEARAAAGRPGCRDRRVAAWGAPGPPRPRGGPGASRPPQRTVVLPNDPKPEVPPEMVPVSRVRATSEVVSAPGGTVP